MTWYEADEYCSQLDLSGTGWVLPPSFWLQNICPYSSYFEGPFDYLWTQDGPPVPINGVIVEMGPCTILEQGKSEPYHVRCIRF